MEQIRNAMKLWPGNLNRRSHFEDLGTDEKIILDWFLEKLSLRMWAGFIWLRKGISGWLL
jgi:hypothetical protein